MRICVFKGHKFGPDDATASESKSNDCILRTQRRQVTHIADYCGGHILKKQRKRSISDVSHRSTRLLLRAPSLSALAAVLPSLSCFAQSKVAGRDAPQQQIYQAGSAPIRHWHRNRLVSSTSPIAAIQPCVCMLTTEIDVFYRKFTYSALACFRRGSAGSASLQSSRKFRYEDLASILFPSSAYPRAISRRASTPMGSVKTMPG